MSGGASTRSLAVKTIAVVYMLVGLAALLGSLYMSAEMREVVLRRCGRPLEGDQPELFWLFISTPLSTLVFFAGVVLYRSARRATALNIVILTVLVVLVMGWLAPLWVGAWTCRKA
jgi:hypothetical protein